MLKTIKYELRQNVGPLLILCVLFVALEAFFLWSVFNHNDTKVIVSMVLLLLSLYAMYLFVLISGISMYSRDLKNKTGYLVFMTPVSTPGIIGAKMLSTLLTGAAIIIVYTIVGVIDLKIFSNEYDAQLDAISKIVEMLFGDTDSISQLAFFVIAAALGFLISFYMVITLAYLAISLSTTILSNKKGSGLVSFIIFAVLWGVIIYITSKLPKGMAHKNVKDFGDAIVYNLPQYGFYLLVCVLNFFGCTWLLENKINL